MSPELTEAQFDALVARAGLPLTPTQRAALRAVWGGVEAWQKAVRDPAPAPEAEPAVTFSAEPGR